MTALSKPGRRRAKIDDAFIGRLRQLLRSDLRQTEIARVLGCNPCTVSAWVKRLGIARAGWRFRLRYDIIGQKFARVSVLRVAAAPHRNLDGRLLFDCRCDCGVEFMTTSASLRTGGTKSCGCLRRQVSASNAAARPRINGGKFAENRMGQ